MRVKTVLFLVYTALFICEFCFAQPVYLNMKIDESGSELPSNMLIKDSFLYTTISSGTIRNIESRNTIYKISTKTGEVLDSVRFKIDSTFIFLRNLYEDNNGNLISVGEFKNSVTEEFCVFYAIIEFVSKVVTTKVHCKDFARQIRGSTLSKKQTSIGVGVSNKNGYAQFYLVDIDSFGVILSEWHYGSTGWQEAKTVAQLPDSGYVIAGWARQSNSFYLDLMLVRTDKEGNQKWMKKYGGPRDDGGGRHVLVLKNGNILVTCSRHWEGTNKPENYVIVVRPDNGNIIWEKRYFHEHNSSFYTNAIEQDDGHINVGGFKQIFVDSINRLEIYSTITKLDKTGNLVFERLLYFNPYKQNYLTGLTQDPDGGFWGYGWTYNTNQDGWLIKVDSLGCPFPDCDSISVSTWEISTEAGSSLRAYPNPASENAIIHYQFSKQVASPMLEIFDLHGKMIARLPLNGETPQGDVWMDLSDWVPGMYVMRIVSQGQVLATGKLLKG